jgi:ribosomal protein L22
MLKRMLPRAKGVASPIQKKMCHVTLVLAESLSPKTNRFKIVAKKKVKAVKERTKKEKKTVPDKDQNEQVSPSQKQNPGFFKKVFRRKSI